MVANPTVVGKLIEQLSDLKKEVKTASDDNKSLEADITRLEVEFAKRQEEIEKKKADVATAYAVGKMR